MSQRPTVSNQEQILTERPYIYRQVLYAIFVLQHLPRYVSLRSHDRRHAQINTGLHAYSFHFKYRATVINDNNDNNITT